MPNAPPDLLEYVLHQCLNTAPQPWYPSAVNSIPRDLLDAALDELRMGNLITLTDWVPQRGQGYTLTREGHTVLHNPGLLGRLRHGDILTPHTPPASARQLLDREAHSAQTYPAETYPGETVAEDTALGRAEAVMAALADKRKPAVSLAIMAVVALVFLAGMWLASKKNLDMSTYFKGDMAGPGNPKITEIFKETGALYPNDVIVGGEWWRLLTYGFVQGNILNFLLYLYFFYSMGPMVEVLWGRWRFAVVFLISTVGGGVAALLYAEQQLPVMGILGVLYGLLGSKAVWVVCNRAYMPREVASHLVRSLLSSAFFLVVIILLPVILGWLPKRSAAPYLGSALAGAAVALPLVYQRFERGAKRALGLAGTIAVPLILLAMIYQSFPEAIAAENPENTKLASRAEEAIFDCLETNVGVRPVKALYRAGPLRQKMAKDTLQQAAAKVTEVHGQLKDYADKMSHSTAKNYVVAGGQFFDQFRRSLDPAVDWTDREENALKGSYEDMEKLGKTLREKRGLKR